MAQQDWRTQDDAILLQPIFNTTRRFYITVGVLVALVLWGLVS